LVTFGILIGSSRSNNNNHQTTNMAPSSDESIASFISPEMIELAAKIFQYSSPQQCIYGEALEYAGVPRNYANTEACKSRLRKEVDVMNVYHGVPRFESTKDEFKNRYETIF